MLQDARQVPRILMTHLAGGFARRAVPTPLHVWYVQGVCLPIRWFQLPIASGRTSLFWTDCRAPASSQVETQRPAGLCTADSNDDDVEEAIVSRPYSSCSRF